MTVAKKLRFPEYSGLQTWACARLFPVSLLFCTYLTACTTAPDSIYWDDDRFLQAPGTVEKDHMLLEENGWRVWRRVTKKEVQCIALKPAAVGEWPRFVNDPGLVNGTPGFYMVIKAGADRPYFGFYAANSFGRIVFADYQGKILRSLNDQALVLSLENVEIPFRISSQVSPKIYQETETQSATLDFTGVNTAYEAMMACHQYSQ